MGSMITAVAAGCSAAGFPDTSGDEKVSARKEGAMGRAIAKAMGGMSRRHNGGMMAFTGNGWDFLPSDTVRRLVLGVMERCGAGEAYLSRSVPNVLRMVLDNPAVGDFTPNRNVVFMRNCVLVLGEGGRVTVEEPSAARMSTIRLDIPYVAGADCPRWKEFLALVIGEEGAVMLLQEFLGCMFVDKRELSVETALFLYGPGSNGKSVISETLKELLGECMSGADLAKLSAGTADADYTAASICGRLLNYTTDASAKDIGGGRYKQMVSREKIMIRQIRGVPFESDDWPMFMSNVNKSIVTTDSSNGFWRRNRVIRLSRRFSDNPDEALGELKADRTFKYSMVAELPGIFNWIIEGRSRIIAQKGVFTYSRAVEEETMRQRDGSTSVFSYLADRGFVGHRPKEAVEGVGYELRKMKLKDMYADYMDWCSEWGYRDGKNRNRFKEDIEAGGLVFRRSIRFGPGDVSSGYVFYEMQFREWYLERKSAESEGLGGVYEDLPF